MSASPPSPDFTVAMPAYNEEAILQRNVAKLTAALEALGCSWQLVIVDDGSRDATPAIAALAAGDPCLRLHHHPCSQGIGQANLTGVHLRAAPGS